LNIAHNYFFMTCEIPNLSTGIMSWTLPSAWKVAILLENKHNQTQQRFKEWGGITL
jgi:hypothetical protein